ncbi:MAG: RNA polymerase sigma-70 factor, partial [Myxococcales bacterium]|nr:RNA polymerase sigma-70 factor [Myxococcales bacterium]
SVRQLVSRAKRSLSTRRRRSEPDPTGHAALLGAVGLAVQTGDLEGLKRVLASDCVFVSDGGGKVVAATREVHGAERVAKLLIGLARKQQGAWTFEPAVLNHQPAVLILEDGRLTTATVFTLQAGRVARIDQIRNPDKLVSLRSVAATR